MSSTRTVIHLDPADPPPTATIVDSIPVVRLSLFPAAVELFLSRNVDEAITQCDELSLCFSQLANKLAQLKHEDEDRRLQAAYDHVDRASVAGRRRP